MMKQLTLNDNSSKQVAKIITLTLQLNSDSESTLYTSSGQHLPAGLYTIDEFNLRIRITKSDDNRYQFKIIRQY